MHHLPHIFFDTLRPERPDCPVLVPSSFTRSRDRMINLDIYSYEPCGLPTGNFMPAEKSQIRLMTASPITLRACIPAPDQVTPERAYFKYLDFYKKTLFHTPFLSRGHAVTLLEYRDAKIVFEVDDWFSQLPQGVQRYLLPLQSMYAKWYAENVRDLTQNYSYCSLCKTKQTNLQRHHMQHHARWRTIWFCPIPGCPSNTRDTTFMEACAAFLTPKMSLSQVMPSGCHLRRVAQPPTNLPAVADRPSASDYPEVEMSVTPEEMRAAVTTPVFQPYRGETGRAWMAKEYGVTMDTSSFMSSETERNDTDDEVCSFDLGPEPYDPNDKARLPSDEWTTTSRDSSPVVPSHDTTHTINIWPCQHSHLYWT